ncbi:STAS domain-containing protein [Streptomyces sp. NPDC002499]
MHRNILEPVSRVCWPPPGDEGVLPAADGLLLAELHGDIDLANTVELRGWLDSVVALRAPAYIVDLRPVTFVDSTGLNLLLRLRRRVLAGGGAFALLCRERTLRLLHAHGSLELFDPATTFPQAVSRVTGTSERSRG